VEVTGRVLPEAEWDRLTDPDTVAVLQTLKGHAAHTTIVVVEKDGDIVGSAVLLDVSYLEGTNIAPQYRRSRDVVLTLVKTIKAAVRAKGRGRMTTMAIDPKVVKLCEALGGERLPGAQFVIPADEE